MTLVRSTLLAILDALPWAVLAGAGTFLVARRSGALPPLLVAELVGLVTLAMLGTISANVARRGGRRFHVTRWIVWEVLLFWP